MEGLGKVHSPLAAPGEGGKAKPARDYLGGRQPTMTSYQPKACLFNVSGILYQHRETPSYLEHFELGNLYIIFSPGLGSLGMSGKHFNPLVNAASNRLGSLQVLQASSKVVRLKAY